MILARPERDPKTPLGGRLRSVRRHFGDEHREVFAKSLDVSKDALAMYERGENAPTAPVLAMYHERYGVDINWLLTGKGDMLVGSGTRIGSATLLDIRKYVRAVIMAFCEKLPSEAPPDQAADQVVETLDYLLTRDKISDDAIAEVVRFGAERLKKKANPDSD